MLADCDDRHTRRESEPITSGMRYINDIFACQAVDQIHNMRHPVNNENGILAAILLQYCIQKRRSVFLRFIGHYFRGTDQFCDLEQFYLSQMSARMDVHSWIRR